MARLRNTRTWAWLALLVATTLLALGLTSPASNAASVCGTSASSTGGIYDGSWTRYYTFDSGNTCAAVTIAYHSWADASSHEHVSYDLSVETGPIQGDDCVQIAFDWAAVGAKHEDVQIMRNCYENSLRTMDVQSHDVDAACSAGVYCAPGAWWVRRIQVGVYSNPTTAIRGRACPTNLAPQTDTSSECTGWNPNGAWNSPAAHIRRTTNTGEQQQSDPEYPAAYQVRQIIDADH